jgi:hypothetical protein
MSAVLSQITRAILLVLYIWVLAVLSNIWNAHRRTVIRTPNKFKRCRNQTKLTPLSEQHHRPLSAIRLSTPLHFALHSIALLDKELPLLLLIGESKRYVGPLLDQCSQLPRSRGLKESQFDFWLNAVFIFVGCI